MRFVFGECELDTERYELRRANQVVALELKAFRVLAYLLQRPGRAVSRQELLQAVWPGAAENPYTAYSLRNCLHKIRQAVGEAESSQAVIETIRGYGYRCVAAVTCLPTDASVSAAVPPMPTAAHAPSALPPPAGWRPLTVLHCALAEPPAWLRQQPEEVHHILQTFYAACEEVIRRFAGTIVQYDPDGLLVYFGYPTADEAAPQQAVRAGLALIDAIAQLKVPGAGAAGNGLRLTVGIHTGPMALEERQPLTASGPVPLSTTLLLTRRAQAWARPGMVVISAETYHLVQGYFTCQALEVPPPAGDTPGFYHVLGEHGRQSRFDVAAARGLSPFVGREPELAVLRQRWAQVQDGRGHAIVLSGEPGIGKSRLVQVFKEHVAQGPHVCWEWRSAPYYAQTPLFPLTEFFSRVLQWRPDETPAVQVAQLEDILQQYRLPLQDTLPLFASLLSVPLAETHYAPCPLSPQHQRQHIFASIVAILLELAERQPVLFILEDLHWTDPTTLEFLELLLAQLPTAALCLVFTCRTEFRVPWASRSSLSHLTLSRLSRAESAALLTQVMHGNALPADVLEYVVVTTDGVPLFIEEVCKMLLESGRLQEQPGGYVLTGPLPSSAIPATLQDLLLARLDRLQEARALLQLGAVLGREFAYEVVQAVSGLESSSLLLQLAQARNAELLDQHGVPPHARYRFTHALIRDTAYNALMPAARQHLHQRIAEVFDARFPDIGATHPELLAQHYTAAGCSAQAIGYWHQAGQQAMARSAYTEAVRHLTTGINVLLDLPDTPERARQELALRLALGRVLMATRGQGAPEVEQEYARALALCQQLEATPQLFPALAGLCGFSVMQGKLHTAQALGEQLLTLAAQDQVPAHRLRAHQALGGVLLHRGEIATACTHWQHALDLCEALPATWQATAGSDLRVVCLSHLAYCLWLRGYPSQARQQSQQAVARAQALAHPFSQVFAWNYAAWVAQLWRDAPGAQAYADLSISCATALGVPDFLAAAMIVRGWALVRNGDRDTGMAQLRQGVAAYRTTGAELHLTALLALLAEACGHTGNASEGCAALDEALACMARSGEWYYAAELYRLKGEVLLTLADDAHHEAAEWFQQAIAMARQQHSKSWELRAAMSLCRLWQRQNKRPEAWALLAPLYHWFTEGFDSGDLQDARVLLAALT
jgi:DNA-binding winged helix-turn-helix (wHTH) protein/predicted ATPase